MNLFFRIFLLFVLSTSLLKVSAQEIGKRELKKMWNAADKYLDYENYDRALEAYNLLIPYQYDCSFLHFKIGLCYYRTHRYPMALRFFESASRFQDTSGDDCIPPVELLYFYAKTLYFSDKPDLAFAMLEQLERELDPVEESEFIAEIALDKEMCDKYLDFIENPVELQIENLGDVINTNFPEYSPVMSYDEKTLIFTSKRDESVGGKVDKQGQFYEDIYISHKVHGEWDEPESISTTINTADHDASITISSNGNELLIYRPEDNGSIYSSMRSDSGWTTPRKLNKNINTSARETHATFSPDGQYLYFTSERAGGLGGLDIYVSKRDTLGRWGVAMNLGPTINTPEDEEGPFLHDDGLTLYFSSKGHASIGGYDVFRSTKTAGQWSEVIHLGYPVNTSKDDVFFVISADGMRAYFSSFKEDTYGESDLYRIDFKQANKQEYVFAKGTMSICDAEQLRNAQVTVTDISTQQINGIYKPNRRNRSYFMVLSPGRSYVLDFDLSGESFFTDTLHIPEDSPHNITYGPTPHPNLAVCDSAQYRFIPYREGVLLTRIYFNDNAYDPARNADLDILSEFLKANPATVINLYSLTTTQGEKEELTQTAESSAKSIKYYLISKGAKATQLQIKAYGPAFPLTYDRALSQYNNRVEICLVVGNYSKLKFRSQDPMQEGYINE